MEKYEKHQLEFLADMYKSFPEDMDSNLRYELGLENITNENTIEHDRPVTRTGRAIGYVANSLKKPAVALATAAVIATSATVGAASDHVDSPDAQMVSDLDVDYSITNGDYIASLEDGRFINIVEIKSGNETQLRANDYNEIGSMNMDGEVLQYTTMTSKGDEQLYRLIELDLKTFQSSVITEEVSTDIPDFYTQHDTDGTNNAYIDSGSVVMNGEVVYNLGTNSLPSVNGDTVAFASEQTKDNETTRSIITMANGEINTIYSGNQSIELIDFMDGEVVYGLENLIDSKNLDLYVGDSVREVPNGMFDADNGNLTWIEQTDDGFTINLHNFETNQTENIYVSPAEMRNPQMSGDIVTWEQKYGLSDNFKSWYSDVADLMTFESDVPVDNGTVDNGTIDNGTIDNGTVDNGTPTVPGTPTEGTDYSGLIAFGAGAGLLGLIYFMNKRKGASEEEAGGLEETIFTEEEIDSIAEAIVDSKNTTQDESVSEEYTGDLIKYAQPVNSEDLEIYELPVEDMEICEWNPASDSEEYVGTEIPVEDEVEAEHRREMEQTEAFFGPTRDAFLSRMEEDDGKVNIINVGPGESAVVNIGSNYVSEDSIETYVGTEVPEPPEIPEELMPYDASKEEIIEKEPVRNANELYPMSSELLTLTPDLDSMTRDELRAFAKERGIRTGGLLKSEIKERLIRSFDEEE